jgi:hypothetical protein
VNHGTIALLDVNTPFTPGKAILAGGGKWDRRVRLRGHWDREQSDRRCCGEHPGTDAWCDPAGPNATVARVVCGHVRHLISIDLANASGAGRVVESTMNRNYLRAQHY